MKWKTNTDLGFHWDEKQSIYIKTKQNLNKNKTLLSRTKCHAKSTFNACILIAIRTSNDLKIQFQKHNLAPKKYTVVQNVWDRAIFTTKGNKFVDHFLLSGDGLIV